MKRFNNQITFIYETASNHKILDSIDEIDLSKFPIPHKGDVLSIANFGVDQGKYSLYKVRLVEYTYKHFHNPENIITFIKVYLVKP